MINCITNSNILTKLLEFVEEGDHKNIVENEFKNMCTRFGLNESEMISLITTHDISLLDTHYDTIWDGFNYYSMRCMDEFKKKYIQSLHNTNLIDLRIENLCDDLKEYIKHNSCINVENDKCNTLKIACERNHDECVKYLLNNLKMYDSEKDVYYYLIVDTNYGNYGNFTMNIIDYIINCGASLNIVKYLFEEQYVNINCYNTNCCNIYHDKFSSFTERYDNCRGRRENTIDLACVHNNLDVIKYLFEIQNKDCTTDAIYNACKNGHLDIVKYLFEIQNKDCTTDAIYNACKNGHLDIVKYLFEIQNKDCTTYAIDYASENGHLGIVKYLFEIQNKDCTTDAINWASKNGHLDIVKYLFEIQNKDCTTDAINWASENGNLDIVAYLFEKTTQRIFTKYVSKIN